MTISTINPRVSGDPKWSPSTMIRHWVQNLSTHDITIVKILVAGNRLKSNKTVSVMESRMNPYKMQALPEGFIVKHEIFTVGGSDLMKPSETWSISMCTCVCRHIYLTQNNIACATFERRLFDGAYKLILLERVSALIANMSGTKEASCCFLPRVGVMFGSLSSPLIFLLIWRHMLTSWCCKWEVRERTLFFLTPCVIGSMCCFLQSSIDWGISVLEIAYTQIIWNFDIIQSLQEIFNRLTLFYFVALILTVRYELWRQKETQIDTFRVVAMNYTSL